MSSIFFIFHNFNQLHQPIQYEQFENEFEMFYFVSIASISSSPSIRVSSQANQTLFTKKRWSNDLCDVCLVLSYWLDDCFSQEFHCIFICLWNSIFFPMKVYLFVLHLLLRGLSYVIDIFLDSVWPIDCFWAQFFAMIPTISHTIPINRNFQWLNTQTNRIPHIFPFHFIIFFCRFVFFTERVFLLS